ncbi:MAG: zinc ribbon domain-containing protein [Patescibacteria group bacterium]
MDAFCSNCGVALSVDVNFCPQCGKKIKEPGPSTDGMTQARIYFLSFAIPGSGFWYGYQYLKHGGEREKKIGYVAMGITLAAILIGVWSVAAFLNQLSQSLQSVQGIGI